MRDGDGCLTAFLVALLLLVVLLLGFAIGDSATHDEFRECRRLLVTADSATVLKTKPECERWTLPVTTEKPR